MAYQWDWQVFCKDTIDGTIVEGCMGKGADATTYLDWMISAWGWTLAVAVCAWFVALLVGAVMGTLRTAPDRRLQLLGNAWVDKANAGKTPFNSEFQDFITRYAWGEVWTRPHYDERTKNLSWAIVGQSEGGKNINRIVKILGRRGVMTATLVSPPDELATAVPMVDALLDGYRYTAGNTYAEYVPDTDKLAEYGLTALVVGGEGEGLRPLVRRTCDFEATLPMAPGVESLNASVAAAVALYELFVRARRGG